MNETARDFLMRAFGPDETVAVLLRGLDGKPPTQRIVPLETMLAARYMAWLGHQNVAGSNVYVSANPLLRGSRRRTKASVASVRHLYLDIDTDGDRRLAALTKSTAVPTPNAIVTTSLGKYQAVWRVRDFDFDVQEGMLKRLAVAFGGDPACTDRNRVIRIPGFFNRKYDPPFRITAEYPSDCLWAPRHFSPALGTSTYSQLDHAMGSRKRTEEPSNSERDWAWITQELARGADAIYLTRELAFRRSDKANPVYYAQRTVDIASARLWLVEGTAFPDVVARLEARRCAELSLPLASARAREIATTAGRMVSRQQLPGPPPEGDSHATA